VNRRVGLLMSCPGPKTRAEAFWRTLMTNKGVRNLENSAHVIPFPGEAVNPHFEA
jgi:hypothetical protein